MVASLCKPRKTKAQGVRMVMDYANLDHKVSHGSLGNHSSALGIWVIVRSDGHESGWSKTQVTRDPWQDTVPDKMVPATGKFQWGVWQVPCAVFWGSYALWAKELVGGCFSFRACWAQLLHHSLGSQVWQCKRCQPSLSGSQFTCHTYVRRKSHGTCQALHFVQCSQISADSIRLITWLFCSHPTCGP